MAQRSKFIIIILAIAVLAQSVLLIGLFLQNRDLKKQDEYIGLNSQEKIELIEDQGDSLFDIEVAGINSVQKAPKQIEDLYVTGWIPDWDFTDGFNSLKENKALFDSISPFRYSLEEDGNFKLLVASSNDEEGSDEEKYPELFEFAESRGMDIIPSFTNFDSEVMTKVLNNPEAFDRQIENMIAAVVENDYQGLDLDYESVLLADREKYFEFLRELGKRLAENDKLFSITVLPKWGEASTIYTAFPQTRKVFDYGQIGEIADQVRIMAYDYTSRFTDFYGPNSPKAWVEDIVRYAIYAGIPREKLILTLPTYSFIYDASLEKLSEINYRYAQQITSTGTQPPGIAVYPEFVEEIKLYNNHTDEREEEWGENILFYTNTEDVEKVLVYPTQQSINERKQIAADYGIKGVAFWRLGDEGELDY